jgi:hypothetical protein
MKDVKIIVNRQILYHIERSEGNEIKEIELEIDGKTVYKQENLF